MIRFKIMAYIEFRYNNFNPYYVADMNDALLHRARGFGRANVRFDELTLVAEDLPTYPQHTTTFLNIINRERKVLVGVDLQLDSHDTPSIAALDQTGSLNQSGGPLETYTTTHPSAFGPIVACQEQWKKLSFDALGVIKQADSLVTHPKATIAEVRNIQDNIHDYFRAGYGLSPTSSALKYSNLFSTVGYTYLIMPPDMDYPEKGTLLPNNTFDDTSDSPSLPPIVQWPDDFTVEWPLQAGDRAQANTPEVLPSSIYGQFDVVKIKAADLQLEEDNKPVLSDPERPCWWLLGVSYKFEGTAPTLRDNTPRYRYDHNLSEFSTWLGLSKVVNISGATLNVFEPSDEYFMDVKYDKKSDADHTRWSSSLSGGAWTAFDVGGTTVYDTDKIIRHFYDPSVGDYVPSHYKVRTTQGCDVSGTYAWLDWLVESAEYVVDYTLNNKFSSSVPFRTRPAGGGDPTKFWTQFGTQGSRDNAYKIDIVKTSATFDFDVIIEDPIDRLVYKGDLLKYEVLVDSLSVDRKVYLDIEYYDSGVTGSTSMLSALIPTVIFDSSYTAYENRWHKVVIPLDGIEGKYIKNIIFRADESNSYLGRLIYYITEVQIMNVVDMFNGRQVMLSSQFSRHGLEDTDNTPLEAGYYLPVAGIVSQRVDGNGDIIEEDISQVYLDNTFDVPATGTDTELKWHHSLHTLNYSQYLKDITIFFGLYKTMVIGGSTGTDWAGPKAGGSVELERLFLYSMSDIDCVYSYCTEASGGGYIDYENVGYKAWAAKLRSLFIEVD